jgi:hypothetical protein
MKKHSVLFSFLLMKSLVFAQNFQDDFKKYFEVKDTVNQLKTLKKWEKAEPKNPELFTSYFNFYALNAKKEILSITEEQPEGESLVIKDSIDKKAGYIGSQTYYNADFVEKAIAKISQGIALHPNRLDMRFGKIYFFGLLKNWDEFTKEIIAAVKHSSTINNNWTWTNNKNREDGKSFFLSSLQTYQMQLYNTENDKLLVNMKDIANEILVHYPENVESLSNLSITYLLTKEYDKGLTTLLKAEKIEPKDTIVLANIAHAYKLKGDKKMASEYYGKMINYGDEDTKEYAKQQIEKLKK